MPPYVNKVILVGYLGQDPELKYLPKGSPMCRFSMATNRGRGTEGKTDWHKIVAWGDLGEMCVRYLCRGSLVYIEGHLENREWNDKVTGKKIRISEVRALQVIPLQEDETIQGYLDEAGVQPRTPPDDFGPTEELAFKNPPCGCSVEHAHSARTGFCMEPGCDDCTGMQ